MNENQNLRGTAQEIEWLYRQKLEQERKCYNRVSMLAGVDIVAELLSEAVSQEVDQTVTFLRTLHGKTQIDAGPGIWKLAEQLARHMDMSQEYLTIMDPLYHPQRLPGEAVDIRGAIYDVLMTLRQRLIGAGTGKPGGYEQEALIARTSRGYLLPLDALSEAAIEEPRIAILMVARKKLTRDIKNYISQNTITNWFLSHHFQCTKQGGDSGYM